MPKPGSAQDRAAAFVASEIDSNAQYPIGSALRKAKEFLDDTDPQKQEIIRQLNEWWANPPNWKKGGGLYKVDLPDEMIARMLDWDAPLEKQPKAAIDLVRDQLKQMGYLGPNDNGPTQFKRALRSWKIENGGMSSSTMEDFVTGGMFGGDQKKVAEELQKRGIPGIKYFDGNSRSAGKGTRNYVVFPGEEKNLKILERE